MSLIGSKFKSLEMKKSVGVWTECARGEERITKKLRRSKSLRESSKSVWACSCLNLVLFHFVNDSFYQFLVDRLGAMIRDELFPQQVSAVRSVIGLLDQAINSIKWQSIKGLKKFLIWLRGWRWFECLPFVDEWAEIVRKLSSCRVQFWWFLNGDAIDK